MDMSEIRKAIRRGLSTLEVPPRMRLSEWAAQHFYLSKESSYVEKPWESFPFQVGILDCMSHDDIREVVVMKSARVGYTKMLLAAMGYYAEHKRRNQAVWQPTDEDADDFVKTEIDPFLRDVAVMSSVMPRYLNTRRKNTLRQKTFLGSNLHIRGGKAAKNYRRLSVDVVYLDELDGFDLDIEKEGSPVTLSRKRIEGATFPKQVMGSTPKLKHLSMIEARADQAECQMRFVIPCPHCDTEHELRWGGKNAAYGFKWQMDDPESVTHVCGDCGAHYGQADYLAVWKRGRWLDKRTGVWLDVDSQFRDADGLPCPAPLSVAFHVWTAYSPMTSWAQIVREFQSAQRKAKVGDRSELKTFINTTLGESWEEEVEQTDIKTLTDRAEPYKLRIVPLGGLVLVAGVDVQDDRFEIVVFAIGRGEETWVIDYAVLQANPADSHDWDKLDAYLQTRFQHMSGQLLGIEAVAIDTGGHFTHQVYAFARERARRRVFAIKGSNQVGTPIKGKGKLQDVNWRGKIIKGGVKLWEVGTDTAKDLIHGRLKVAERGPGYVHFSQDLPPEFYTQLTSEVRVLQRTSTGERYRWVKRMASARNEVLDCYVYALFASHMLDLHRATQAMWDRIESVVQPKTRDMFAIEQPVPEARQADAQVVEPAEQELKQQDPAPQPVRYAAQRPKMVKKSSFVKGWQ